MPTTITNPPLPGWAISTVNRGAGKRTTPFSAAEPNMSLQSRSYGLLLDTHKIAACNLP